MSTMTITAKRQITLSEDVLTHLAIRPGQKVTVEKLPGGRVALKAERPRGKISDVFGFLRRKGGPSLSIEDINESAGCGWASRR